MVGAMADFPLRWIGPCIPGVRDGDGTYCETPLQDLPSVEVSDDLNWLEPLHPDIDAEMKDFRRNAIERQLYSQQAGRILSQANEMALRLPIAFKQLIQSEELQHRFPSATACYFDLPDAIVEAPFGMGGHIIRFLNDQQSCVLWYLYLPAQGVPSVIASCPVEGADFLEELNSDDANALADSSAETRIVAHTFPEFLYRYWLENNLWFKISLGIDFTDAESEYVRKC